MRNYSLAWTRRDVRFQDQAAIDLKAQRCPVMAQTGPPGMSAVRPLSGAKQTLSNPHSASSTHEYTP
jgi:hypothetical protein